MSAGLANDEVTRLQGWNPYWRLAFNHEWGPHSLMVGTSGMQSRFYADPADPGSLQRQRDLIIDSQYQYLLDPHALSAQFAYERSRPEGGEATNLLRTKFTYVYSARVGASFGLFDSSGSAGTRGATAEAFWMPVQYVRVGVQYTAYDRFAGARLNYDGLGRNARDNDTLFFYVWGAY